jgi:DNA-binding NtrC family response regulator
LVAARPRAYKTGVEAIPPNFPARQVGMARLCRILVVEDNEGIRDFLRSLFDDEGYHITVVAGGEPMRASLAAATFDVALIDVTLPGAEDGFALAALARQAGCGVILVTGDARHFDTLETSGYHYMLKPFRVERLLQLVSQLIEDADCRVAQR